MGGNLSQHAKNGSPGGLVHLWTHSMLISLHRGPKVGVQTPGSGCQPSCQPQVQNLKYNPDQIGCNVYQQQMVRISLALMAQRSEKFAWNPIILSLCDYDRLPGESRKNRRSRGTNFSYCTVVGRRIAKCLVECCNKPVGRHIQGVYFTKV